jgi:hypothetical protein
LDAELAGRAIDLPSTHRSLRWSAALVATFAVMALALLVAGAGLWWREHEVISLADTGVRTTGTVTAVQSRVVARERHTIGTIDVVYDVNGESRQTRFDVINHVVQYHPGDRVDVAYDAAQPDRVDLVGDVAASQGFVPWEVPLAFAGLALLLSAIAVRHLRTVRGVVRDHEWLAVPAVRKPATRAWRGRGSTVVELGEPASPERVVASPVGIRALPPTIEPVAWVAGWGQRRFVVAPPGGRPLLLVQRETDTGTDAEPDGPLGPGVDGVSEPHSRHAP